LDGGYSKRKSGRTASKARENRIEWEENNVEMMKMYTANRKQSRCITKIYTE
jgi:hypothetical protein